MSSVTRAFQVQNTVPQREQVPQHGAQAVTEPGEWGTHPEKATWRTPTSKHPLSPIQLHSSCSQKQTQCCLVWLAPGEQPVNRNLISDLFSIRYPNSQYSKWNTGNARRDLVQNTTYLLTWAKINIKNIQTQGKKMEGAGHLCQIVLHYLQNKAPASHCGWTLFVRIWLWSTVPAVVWKKKYREKETWSRIH